MIISSEYLNPERWNKTGEKKTGEKKSGSASGIKAPVAEVAHNFWWVVNIRLRAFRELISDTSRSQTGKPL